MGLDVKKYMVRCIFTEPVLGTQPQKDIAMEYLMSRNAAEGKIPETVPTTEAGLPADELETLDEQLAKGTTAFHREGDTYLFYDYQIKGFIKEAASVFNGQGGIKNAKSKADNYIFIFPRRIPLVLPTGVTAAERLSRPLRGMTMQGPRVSIVSSEMLPVGTQFEFSMHVFDKGDISLDLLTDWFDYGAYKGIGQWRNGSYGRFEYSLSLLR